MEKKPLLEIIDLNYKMRGKHDYRYIGSATLADDSEVTFIVRSIGKPSIIEISHPEYSQAILDMIFDYDINY